MTARGRASKNRPYHHGNLRDALIVAAAELIQESGSEDFAMIEAARKANVSSAAPYRHFREKDDLLRAVSELGFFDLARHMLAIRSSCQPGSVACIVAMGKGYVRFVTERAAFFDLMWGDRGVQLMAELDEGDSQFRVTGFNVLVEEVELWCEHEGLGDTDPLDLAMKLWAMAMGLSHLVINHYLERFNPGVDAYQMLESSTHAFLQGVKQGREAN
ncbi:MAG: TetR/AcrR family transcriptional regulator [Halioglobus sp.]|nr:TetR/AcrR family transcriptional regulator [Halioglobus sp.]